MNNVQLTLVLAVVSMIGIIGMLLFDGVPDFFAFLLAATPLYFGGLRFWKNRSISRRTR